MAVLQWFCLFIALREALFNCGNLRVKENSNKCCISGTFLSLLLSSGDSTAGVRGKPRRGKRNFNCF